VDTRASRTYEGDMITQLNFVSIPVTDQQRALDFYTKRLGFTVFTDQPFGEGVRWIELKVGRSDVKVVLFTPDEHKHLIGTKLNISFKCGDVEKTVAELRERGVEFESEPQKFHWGWHAQFKDPDGNVFSLSD
jgi:predicted enzyme related to lactoylglutathione lyase